MNMKKSFKLIISTLLLAIMVLVPFANVDAASNSNIKTIDASISNGTISVSGTTEDGVLAVAIMVYDSTETNLITMQTTSVGSDNSYSDTISIASGTYVVKVANYDGGEYVTKTVKEKITDQENGKQEENENTNTEVSNEVNKNENTATNSVATTSNPKTGDNIIFYIAIFVIAVLGIIITIKINKTKEKVRKH